MARVETIGDATLYLGDCRGVLRDLQADALITDPVWPNAPDGMFPGVEPYTLFASAWFKMPLIKRAVIVMRHDSDPYFLAPIKMSYQRAVFLPYAMPGYIGRFLGGDEIAYCYGEPIPSRKGQRVIPGRAPIVQPGGRAANGHPCSRAIDHFMFLVRWWSEPGETVIDPFMGSGTTGEACLRLGRKFIGIEVEEKYFDLACERIERATHQGDMFVPSADDASELAL